MSCCGRFIENEERPETAEQLMRSRYSAFVLKNENYLLATWHPDTRPANGLTLDSSIHWLGLRIIKARSGCQEDKQGTVEFIASYKLNGRVETLHEKSRFENCASQWFYIDGELMETQSSTPSRNQPCPCGSGKKYKRCCAKY
jgi:SEC-C motif-containing protein